MGRQTGIFMTRNDEELFLNYLSQVGNIVILETSSDRIDDFVRTSFSPEPSTHWQYFLWNKRFDWKPEIRKSSKDPERYYITNMLLGPLIEFSRSDVYRNFEGRIYWSKFIVTPDGPGYDFEEFSKWYDSVVRWIKKNAAGKTKYVNVVTYYFPDAWRIYQELRKEGSGE